jgi:hypothetical protein
MRSCGRSRSSGGGGHGAADDVTVGDVAGDDFETVVGIQGTIVTESADGDVAEVLVGEDAMDEIGANFASCTGDEDAFHEGFLLGRFHRLEEIRC